MNAPTKTELGDSREHLVHALYEAAELEHNLMCTYLYAAFSLKSGPDEGLDARETEAVGRWRRSIMQVAVEEMGHLAAVWNITVALGGAPRVGRSNFPLDIGYLPASVVVKLAPFCAATLQHFIYLERPHGSLEAEGEGFAPERRFERGAPTGHLTPMPIDYDTVGDFYQAISRGLAGLVGRVGEGIAFLGDPALQLSGAEFGLAQARPVRCLKTAQAAFDSIVSQGEGSPADARGSHFNQFLAIRAELQSFSQANGAFAPATPAATNPVLRRPPRPEGRVWLEHPEAIATVDLGNAAYGLMLRLLAFAYSLPSSNRSRRAALDLGVGLMRAIVPLGEHAARLPAGPSNPHCHAGMSFTALRDSAALPAGAAAGNFFVERLEEFALAAQALARGGAARPARAAEQFAAMARKGREGFEIAPVVAVPAGSLATAPKADRAPAPSTVPGGADPVEIVDGKSVQIRFHARRCIHARFCVTGAPKVFLANVQGPWIHPDAMSAPGLVEIAHACPSGAIQYVRLDGQPGEAAPPVNLASVREAGPYAFRAPLRINGQDAGFRATLCRCGASRNKPFCDGSHHEVGFGASGEPPTADATALAARDGVLAIEPQPDGPLQVDGNLEILSGTGRIVARVTAARLCRCGGSQSKPFCDGTHARIGFRS